MVLSESLSMKMIMMDIPSPTRVGQAVELVCNYDLEGETLYSVKWYKDGIEFYRFVPNDWPPGQFLTLPGIRVDLSRSNRQSVYLREVDLDTAGVYRCEVSAEAPVFDTVSAKKEMKVFALPAEAPKITGKNGKYRIGDTVSVNCSSAKSKPAATLRWYINDLPVGPEYETSHSTILHADGLESSTLSLRFVVKEHHFVNSNMRIRCSATIPRVYTMSDEELVVGGRLQQASGLLHISENVSKESVYNLFYLSQDSGGFSEEELLCQPVFDQPATRFRSDGVHPSQRHLLSPRSGPWSDDDDGDQTELPQVQGRHERIKTPRYQHDNGPFYEDQGRVSATLPVRSTKGTPKFQHKKPPRNPKSNYDADINRPGVPISNQRSSLKHSKPEMQGKSCVRSNYRMSTPV
ncbi:uncharacterized protein LOC143236115 [Tachypleus tridentatus]|uniref:uncharacterized protein LOC143236115 n=1 Tax=Tachypleus tridentatus TaxID=6853 RepID=UPI003FD0B509